MLPLSYPFRWRLAGIFLLLFVLGLAITPDFWPWSGSTGSRWHLSDKWMHGITFAVLAIWYAGQYARRYYGLLAVGLLFFGLLIEACQSMLSYRTADSGDLVADVLGIAAGVAIALAGVGGWSLRFENWLRIRFG